MLPTQPVNPAQNQAVQTVGQFQPNERAGFTRINPLVVQVVQQFFQIKRIALRPLHQLRDQRGRQVTRPRWEELEQLQLDHLRDGGTREDAETDLRTVGQSFKRSAIRLG